MFLSVGANISLILSKLTASRQWVPSPWKDSLTSIALAVDAVYAVSHPMMLMRHAARKANFLPFHCIIVGISMLGIPVSPCIDPETKYFIGYIEFFDVGTFLFLFL